MHIAVWGRNSSVTDGPTWSDLPMPTSASPVFAVTFGGILAISGSLADRIRSGWRLMLMGYPPRRSMPP